ncbi:MAG: hypothetical protein DMG06_22675 [Acidobacteria bacterium]|nr:MAG: hypothetical protein DMG06_22675 [Acidobacteriota bacterium]
MVNPTGTYGLALQPLSASSLLSAGDTGHAIWASQGNDYRTNVALVLLDPNSSAQVVVYDAQNQMRGSTTLSSPVPISWQTTLPSLIGTALALGRVEFRVSQGRAAGYTAVVDNVTGDGIAALAERLDSGATDFLLDGVARTPGANNTHWSTDVRLFNPNDTPLDINIDSAGFSSGNSTVTRSIPPSGLIEIVDILGAGGFGYPDGVAGALRCNNGLGHVSQCIGDGVVLSGVTCRSCRLRRHRLGLMHH